MSLYGLVDFCKCIFASLEFSVDLCEVVLASLTLAGPRCLVPTPGTKGGGR